MLTGSNHIDILGVKIDDVTLGEAVGRIKGFVKAVSPHLVVTCNPEMVMTAFTDQLLAEILRRADLVVPDGIGVVWASRVLKRPLTQRVPGIELMEAALAEAAREGWRVFLLGSEPGVAERAAQAMQKSFAGLNIVGTHHGFFSREEEPQVLQMIKDAMPQILFLALGVPRQEKWAAAHLGSLRVPVAMGVGGSLNVWAGVDRRAPAWMRQVHLEWLYRIVRQPWRLRRAMAIPRFMAAVLWERFGEGVSEGEAGRPAKRDR